MSISVSLEDESPALVQAWSDLADSTDAQPFNHPGWIQAWRASWGRGKAVCLVARRGRDLVGLLPLERRGGGLHSPTNWHTPEFGAVAVDEPATKELVSALFAQRTRACSLGFVDEADVLHRTWDTAARLAGHKCLTRVVQSSPFIDTNGSWEDYEEGLAKKLRTELRRRRRRLEEEGELRVELHRGDNELGRLLDEGFGIEEAAWKGSKGTAINSDQATRSFYESTARWASDKGWLQLGFLRLNEQALAFDLSLEANGVHYLIKTGYEPSRRKFAPGMLMRYEMIKGSFESSHTSYEFLGSNNPWKLEWTDTLRDRMLLQAFSPSLTGRAEWAAYAHIRPRAKRLVQAARKKR